MTTDHLDTAQEQTSGFGPGYVDTMGWGFGMAIRTQRVGLGPSAGSYGWTGYYGTAWYNDPAERMSTIILMQRAHAEDPSLPMWEGLWEAVYEPIRN